MTPYRTVFNFFLVVDLQTSETMVPSYPFKEDGFIISETQKALMNLAIYAEEGSISVLLDVYEALGPMNWARLTMILSYAKRYNLSMQEWNVVYEWIMLGYPHAVPSLGYCSNGMCRVYGDF